jgi:hypothetical protein
VVIARDAAGGVNAVPKVIDRECHYQRFSMATLRLGENQPQAFGWLNAGSCYMATKAFCKIAQKIKAFLDISTSVDFREVDFLIAVQGWSGGKNPIGKLLICLIEWLRPSVVARTAKHVLVKVLSVVWPLYPRPTGTAVATNDKGLLFWCPALAISSNQVAPFASVLVTVGTITTNPAFYWRRFLHVASLEIVARLTL